MAPPAAAAACLAASLSRLDCFFFSWTCWRLSFSRCGAMTGLAGRLVSFLVDALVLVFGFDGGATGGGALVAGVPDDSVVSGAWSMVVEAGAPAGEALVVGSGLEDLGILLLEAARSGDAARDGGRLWVCRATFSSSDRAGVDLVSPAPQPSSQSSMRDQHKRCWECHLTGQNNRSIRYHEAAQSQWLQKQMLSACRQCAVEPAAYVSAHPGTIPCWQHIQVKHYVTHR